jgi:hypothetical protein
MKVSTIKFILILLFVFSNPKAQPFGFGCLGLSGFYAGYARIEYSVPGINEFVTNSFSAFPSTSSLTNKLIEFKQGTGYRIGTNLFRAKFDKIFVSAKGYYQFLREERETSGNTPAGILQKKFQLTMNHWGAGIDFGVKLFAIVDLKLVEANVTFFNTEFVHQEYLSDVLRSEEIYKPDKMKIDYFLGSGFIIHLIPDYISAEGTFGFHFMQIENLTTDDGATIPITSSTKKAVEKIGFSAIIQLNVGFPL